MPSRNIVKQYIENGYYHIYNRGVEKRIIFQTETDCKVFLRYIKLYLSPKEELIELDRLGQKTLRFLQHNLYDQVDLLAFALMPNHFHLLIKQYTQDGIIKFMRRLTTSYSMYFNKKYTRTGGLFQGTYKAINVESDEYLVYLSKYIHLNPTNIKSKLNYADFSSYPYYIGTKQAQWVKPQVILDYFSQNKQLNQQDYKNFVKDYETNIRDKLEGLMLEDEF